jgi:hypothetical protein
MSRLSWRNVTIGTDREWPKTNEHVWTAPRKTEATPVATSEGEAEKYLFYRGVGNFKVPLRVTHNLDTKQLSIHGNFDHVISTSQEAKINAAWLVHIRSDGKTAFRRIDDLNATKDANGSLATTSSRFDEKDYRAVNIESLRQDMHKALVAEGLFEDEAYAMLRTWDRAYFQKPGLRLFYTVPRSWTDYQMPLQVSLPAKIERVMIGRIELISDEQRALLDRLSQAAISKPDWISKIWESPNAKSFFTGHSEFDDLGVTVPPDYQMYLSLGRFRNALVTARLREQPTDSLRKFVSTYQLEQFRVPGDTSLTSQPTRAPSGGE